MSKNKVLRKIIIRKLPRSLITFSNRVDYKPFIIDGCLVFLLHNLSPNATAFLHGLIGTFINDGCFVLFLFMLLVFPNICYDAFEKFVRGRFTYVLEYSFPLLIILILYFSRFLVLTPVTFSIHF